MAAGPKRKKQTKAGVAPALSAIGVKINPIPQTTETEKQSQKAMVVFLDEFRIVVSMELYIFSVILSIDLALTFAV